MATSRKPASKASSKSAPSTPEGPFGKVQTLIDLVQSSSLDYLRWSKGDETIVLRKQVAGPAPSRSVEVSARPAPKLSRPAQATAAASPPPPVGTVVTSPFVGTFYRSPSPDQPAYVDVGASVRKGQVLCIVEAMKLMNEIECEVEGRVVEVLADNAQPVEFGQALFRIEPKLRD